MFKKILVPVDFSEASKVSIRYAESLVAEKGQIALIHIFPAKIRETISFYEVPEKVKDLERRIEELRAKAQDELLSIADGLLQRGFNVKVLFREGDPPKEVAEESAKGYDLVVVGIPKERVQVASTALNIIKNSRVSTLVVKESKVKPKFEKVLFTTDFSEISKTAFKELVPKFIKKFSAQVTVLNVFELYPVPYLEQGTAFFVGDLEEVKKNLRERLLREFPGENLTYSVVEGTDAGVEIVDFAESGKYNIIIVSYEEKDWVERAVIGSVSTKVVKLAKIPVLVFKRH